MTEEKLENKVKIAELRRDGGRFDSLPYKIGCKGFIGLNGIDVFFSRKQLPEHLCDIQVYNGGEGNGAVVVTTTEDEKNSSSRPSHYSILESVHNIVENAKVWYLSEKGRLREILFCPSARFQENVRIQHMFHSDMEYGPDYRRVYSPIEITLKRVVLTSKNYGGCCIPQEGTPARTIEIDLKRKDLPIIDKK